MTRIFAIALAASAMMLAMPAAEAHSLTQFGAGAFSAQHPFQVAYHGGVTLSVGDDDDDDYDVSDEDDDEDDDSSDSSIIVEDIEDCAPGKYRMVDFGNIEVPVACH